MTKLHHPTNKYQRKLIEEKKHIVSKSERPAKIRKKLTIEEARLHEIEAELQDAVLRTHHEQTINRRRGS
jgi:hypothetical protein